MVVARRYKASFTPPSMTAALMTVWGGEVFAAMKASVPAEE